MDIHRGMNIHTETDTGPSAWMDNNLVILTHTLTMPANWQRMIILERVENHCPDFPVMGMSVYSIILDWNVVLFADANNKWRL